MSDASGRLARWRLRPSKSEIGIMHRTGIKHQAADALSRLSKARTGNTIFYDEVTVLDLKAGTFRTVYNLETEREEEEPEKYSTQQRDLSGSCQMSLHLSIKPGSQVSTHRTRASLLQLR